tara:strand:- start:119 stop:397 length:279 start_codon:yes stop_codon:yes gene_type:complete
MAEETQKPYITIDDVQISIEDLPEEAQGIFGRVQRLTQKKAVLTLDLEETQASINWFTSRIVEVINAEANEVDGISKEEDHEVEKEAVKSNN